MQLFENRSEMPLRLNNYITGKLSDEIEWNSHKKCPSDFLWEDKSDL